MVVDLWLNAILKLQLMNNCRAYIVVNQINKHHFYLLFKIKVTVSYTAKQAGATTSID